LQLIGVGALVQDAQAFDIETEVLTKVIVGLGNPGKRYAGNRHNVGFMVLESLALEATGNWRNHSLCRTCRIQLSGCQVLLAEPLTYMNQSGKAVGDLLSALRRNPQDIMLIVDDLNLPFGRIRIRERGTAGGHHGLESILTALNTEDVLRIRMGIGEEQMPEEKAEFVLSDFPSGKQSELDDMVIKAGNAVKSILSDGVAKTMAIFNA
jgi:peptidyl-tRNA hydrolase, PTH1 family